MSKRSKRQMLVEVLIADRIYTMRLSGHHLYTVVKADPVCQCCVDGIKNAVEQYLIFENIGQRSLLEH